MADDKRTDTTESEKLDLAEEFYEQELLPKLLETEKGKILVLDIESHDYAIGADRHEADTLLKERRPGSFGYAFRIGYRTVGTLGGRMRAIDA